MDNRQIRECVADTEYSLKKLVQEIEDLKAENSWLQEQNKKLKGEIKHEN